METVDGGAEPAKKAKAKSVPWTQAEIQTLQRAIGVHGTRWTLIKQDPEFKDVLWRPIKSLAVSKFAKCVAGLHFDCVTFLCVIFQLSIVYSVNVHPKWMC
jgi:hypothetical protein